MVLHIVDSTGLTLYYVILMLMEMNSLIWILLVVKTGWTRVGIPISGYGGEKLYLQHVEPKTRLVITNIMQGIRLSSRTSIQTYEIESLGLSSCT